MQARPAAAAASLLGEHELPYAHTALMAARTVRFDTRAGRWRRRACARYAAFGTSALDHPSRFSPPLAPPHHLQARSFSASTLLRVGDGTSVGNGVGVNASASAPASAPAAPAGSIKTRTFWVQLKGDAGLAPLPARGDMLIGFLAEEIANKLKLTQRTSSLVLQLASEDGKLFFDKDAKDAAGNPQPVTLNSMDTIDEALKKAAKAAKQEIKVTDKLRIIVDVSAPAAPGAAGIMALTFCEFSRGGSH